MHDTDELRSAASTLQQAASMTMVAAAVLGLVAGGVAAFTIKSDSMVVIALPFVTAALFALPAWLAKVATELLVQAALAVGSTADTVAELEKMAKRRVFEAERG